LIRHQKIKKGIYTMALSVVDLYQKVLPRTNCKECGFQTCIAFASMVVAEKLPLKNCPHIPADLLEKSQEELNEQYAAGKWLKKDMAQDALRWAKERAASMNLTDLPARIGGDLIENENGTVLKLPYFTGFILIRPDHISKENGDSLNRWEQVFIFNHMAQGGSRMPVGKWKGLEGFPNTISKMKSMVSHVETPLRERFSGHMDDLKTAAFALGGTDMTEEIKSADFAVLFNPLPKIPILLMFWDADKAEDLDARVKLLFDETITEHLDIESIMFLSERLKQLLCGEV
jgi:hypothetical protein